MHLNSVAQYSPLFFQSPLNSSLICIVVITALMTGCGAPKVHDFPPPPKSQWKPMGERMAASHQNSVIPLPMSWKTMHSDTVNSDNVWIAAAPMFELDWIAETTMYIPEGPTFDRNGNIYFSPLEPPEDVSLVAIDGKTGQRRWTIPGEGGNAGSGAILVLNSSDDPNRDILYHSTSLRARAITTEGKVLWETPTGLSEADALSHSFGMNYHPQTDSVVGVTMGGYLFAMDRISGKSRDALIRLPGSPTPASDQMPPRFLIDAGDKATDKAFGRLSDGSSFFSAVLNAIFGGGDPVTNYFSIDPNTGKIYIAATAPDKDDGTEDNLSELGAIYLIDLIKNGEQYEFVIENYTTFEGGTGSTPSVSADSSRVIVSDSGNNVIALDAKLNELWRLPLQEQVAASIAIAPENNELYAVTGANIYKIIDHGSHAEIAWTADLDAFNWGAEVNLLTPTITANGIVVSVAAGIGYKEKQLILSLGVGMLDRATGKFRYFAKGREESISVSSVAPDGGIVTAASPVRRAISVGLLKHRVAPLVGGISRFKPVRIDLLVRDAACAASDRLENYNATYKRDLLKPDGKRNNVRRESLAQIKVLLQQSEQNISLALDEGSLTQSNAKELLADLVLAQRSLEQFDSKKTAEHAASVCDSFD